MMRPCLLAAILLLGSGCDRNDRAHVKALRSSERYLTEKSINLGPNRDVTIKRTDDGFEVTYHIPHGWTGRESHVLVDERTMKVKSAIAGV